MSSSSSFPEKEPSAHIHAFAPIADAGSRVLVLGSMPSDTSLRKNEYYGHPSNAFWPIMERLSGHPLFSYDEKVRMLHSHRVALWDVLASCTRDRSADHTIRSEIPNDIPSFLFSHPHIRTILCNGTVAHRMFIRHVVLPSVPKIVVEQLPSTSAANTLQFETKANIWLAKLRNVLDLS